MKTMAVGEAKAHFSACVRHAEAGESVLILRHGRAAAALIPPADLERLQRMRAAGPDAGLAGLAGGWRGSEELADALDEHTRSAPRGPADLEA